MLINLSIILSNSHNFAYYAHRFHLLAILKIMPTLKSMILKLNIKCYLLSDHPI